MKARVMIKLASGMALLASLYNAQSIASTPVAAHHLYETCKAALVKKYADEKVSDPESAAYAAHHTCSFFVQKCKTEPEGETCKKAIADFSGK